MSALLLRLENITLATLLLLLEGVCSSCRIKVGTTFSKSGKLEVTTLTGDHAGLAELRGTIIALAASSTEGGNLAFSLRLFNSSVHPPPDEIGEIQPPQIPESEW